MSVEDVVAVLPTPESLDPLSDPAFRVPRVGRDVDMLDEADFWGPPGVKKAVTGEQGDGRRQGGGVADDPRGVSVDKHMGTQKKQKTFENRDWGYVVRAMWGERCCEKVLVQIHVSLLCMCEEDTGLGVGIIEWKGSLANEKRIPLRSK